MVCRSFLKQSAFALALLTLAVPAFGSAADDKKADPPKKRVVGILIYPEVETIDFCGPYEVFTVAHTHDASPADAKPGEMGRMTRLFDVRVVAATADPVAVRGGMRVVPTDTFASCPQVDILVIPGHPNGDVLKDKALVAWVAEQAKKAELVTSVCTGSFILAEAGLLDGKSSATHQMFLKEMQGKYPKVTVVAGKRVVEDGNVVTSAGMSSGLDMSLKVLGKLHGEGVAKMASQLIEYPPPAAESK